MPRTVMPRTASPQPNPATRRRGRSLFQCFTIREIQALLERGADVNEHDEHGRTPLHCACLRQTFGAVEALLTARADPNAMDGSGQTPLHAILNSDSFLNPSAINKLLILLLNAGADPNVPNRRGLTALHLAASRGNEGFCGRLIDAGGDFGARRRKGKTPAELLKAKLPDIDRESPWKERYAALAFHQAISAPETSKANTWRRI